MSQFSTSCLVLLGFLEGEGVGESDSDRFPVKKEVDGVADMLRVMEGVDEKLKLCVFVGEAEVRSERLGLIETVFVGLTVGLTVCVEQPNTGDGRYVQVCKMIKKIPREITPRRMRKRMVEVKQQQIL